MSQADQTAPDAPSAANFAAAAENFVRTVLRNPWVVQKPHPAQAKLFLSPAREILYGGAGGGGKSSAILMAAAQYVDVPGYAALILRRTFRDLEQPDSLIPRSKAWWLDTTRAHWSEGDKRWTFPSGATITFGYIGKDDDRYQYAGAAYQTVCFDELTQFKERNYEFLFSRLRRASSGPLASVPPRMISASNPGGIGHAWVKRRFIDHPKGAVYIPALARENPAIDFEDYKESLSHLDELTRRRILDGDWDAAAGGRFLSRWLNHTFAEVYGKHFQGGKAYKVGDDLFDAADCWVIQTCDPAASEKDISRETHDPDYTCLATFVVTPKNHLLWIDCDRFRLEVPDIVPRVRQSYLLYRPAYLAVEAVASNRAVQQLCAAAGMAVVAVSPRGRDKLVRAQAAMAAASNRRVLFPEGNWPWKEQAIGELVTFTGKDRKGQHDDVVDCLSYAVEAVEDHADADDGLPFVLGRRAY